MIKISFTLVKQARQIIRRIKILKEKNYIFNVINLKNKKDYGLPTELPVLLFGVDFYFGKIQIFLWQLLKLPINITCKLNIPD